MLSACVFLSGIVPSGLSSASWVGGGLVFDECMFVIVFQNFLLFVLWSNVFRKVFQFSCFCALM